MVDYHDSEWGIPVHDDQKLFEYLVLDAFQAGLSWAIVLRKREAMKQAFHGFNPEAVAQMSQTEVEEVLMRPEIIRNRAKVTATVENARKFLEVVSQFASFDRYIWEFVGGRTIQNSWTSDAAIPAETDESRALSKDLRARGFRFTGPTICYAVMQSAGLVNDHLVDCYRYRAVRSDDSVP